MKLFQCGYSGFIYELFRDKDGTVRATKTSMRNGKLCLEKEFGTNVQAGREWLVERNRLDQEFTLACKKLVEKSDDY
jgi:hypothetical protein